MTKETSIKLFESKKIRVHWDNESEKWYFSVIDIIETLSKSNNPRRYQNDLKRKLTKEEFNQLYEIIVQLKLEALDGKKYTTDCANTEELLRITNILGKEKLKKFLKELILLTLTIYCQITMPTLKHIKIPQCKHLRFLYALLNDTKSSGVGYFSKYVVLIIAGFFVVCLNRLIFD